MAYNIAVIGTGYVGLVSGTTFAATGNNVICVDIDEEKVKKLSQGIPTIYEPGLEYYLKSNIKECRIRFTSDLEDAVKNSRIIFLCLPTPPNEDGSADLHHVLNVAGDIANIIKYNDIKSNRIIVNKSTVPVGTGEKVKSIFNEIAPKADVNIVSNPEFLREGFAIEDAMKPERVVIGVSEPKVGELMKDLYAPFVRSGNPVHILDIKSAEVTKYAANSFLAVKISFMNDLSAYCEKVGADIEKIRAGMGSDTRIGKRFLFAGLGYGGSCFPKDVKALIYSAKEVGSELSIVQAAQDVNQKQIKRFAQRIIDRFAGDLKGKKIALWGLAFKPNTDDTREAPAFIVIEELLAAGAKISAYDPEAVENTKRKYGDKIEYVENMYDCLDSADVLAIATEWNVFRSPDFDLIKTKMKSHIIYDGRNLFEPCEISTFGFEYHCIGRQ
jgi:UDPglucose 6-dehydrogenase